VVDREDEDKTLSREVGKIIYHSTRLNMTTATHTARCMDTLLGLQDPEVDDTLSRNVATYFPFNKA